MALHSLSWRAFAEFSLGDWPVVVDEILPRIRVLLGDRKNDPPYFTVHALGSGAFIHEARGDPAAPELIALLRRPASVEESTAHHSRTWLAWILARQGEVAEVEDLLERLASIPSQVDRPFEDQVRAIVLAEHERWDEVPAFLERSRTFAEQGGLRALPVHLDRLEGRAASAAGDHGRAMELLARASSALEELGARWEKACTDLSLTEVLIAAGRTEDARSTLEPARAVFEDLGSLREIDAAGALRSVLD